MNTDGINAVTSKAVVLYAIGQPHAAAAHIQAVMTERADALTAATGLALLVTGNEPAVWDIIGLPTLRHRRAAPVVTHLLALARGHHHGGLYQLWDQLPAPVAGDVLAVLLAMAGAAACHPEWN